MRYNSLMALLGAFFLSTSTAHAATEVTPTRSAEGIKKLPGESDEAFVDRVFKIPEGNAHIVTANWNGVPTMFVDFERNDDPESPERPLFALQQQPSGAFRKIDVTLGETEGGSPDIEGIGFANADHDPALELIVVLAWHESHSGGCGPLYEVRILDDLKPGETELRQLPVSKHFGLGCADTPKHYRYTTVAAVKGELKRLGY